MHLAIPEVIMYVLSSLEEGLGKTFQNLFHGCSYKKK